MNNIRKISTAIILLLFGFPPLMLFVLGMYSIIYQNDILFGSIITIIGGLTTMIFFRYVVPTAISEMKRQ